ncbi:MAG: DUF2163 domain-containing protein [Pseudomonadota bacterium]
MSRLPDALADHLNGEVTTSCSAWTLTLANESRLGFTDHDTALMVDNVICEPGSGFRATEAASQLGMSIDDQEIEGALSGTMIRESDIRAGLFDGASVDIWLVNWAAPEAPFLQRRAHLGRISQSDGVFRADLEGLTAKLAAHTGRNYTRNCDALLGDARCGVDINRSEFMTNVVVETVTQTRTLVVTGLDGYADAWFAGGTIRWTDGPNAGRSMEIASDVRSERSLILWEAMADTIAPGDMATVTAGCDKRFATCKTKFANPLNFRGHPHVPGDDFVMGYADGNTVHDGSPIIP